MPAFRLCKTKWVPIRHSSNPSSAIWLLGCLLRVKSCCIHPFWLDSLTLHSVLKVDPCGGLNWTLILTCKHTQPVDTGLASTIAHQRNCYCSFEQGYANSFETLLPILIINLKWNCWSQGNYLFVFLRNRCTVFHSSHTSFHSPPTGHKGCSFSVSLITLCHFLLIVTMLTGMKWYVTVVFICVPKWLVSLDIISFWPSLYLPQRNLHPLPVFHGLFLFCYWFVKAPYNLFKFKDVFN